jgi:hypothetical protein
VFLINSQGNWGVDEELVDLVLGPLTADKSASPTIVFEIANYVGLLISGRGGCEPAHHDPRYTL